MCAFSLHTNWSNGNLLIHLNFGCKSNRRFDDGSCFECRQANYAKYLSELESHLIFVSLSSCLYITNGRLFSYFELKMTSTSESSILHPAAKIILFPFFGYGWCCANPFLVYGSFSYDVSSSVHTLVWVVIRFGSCFKSLAYGLNGKIAEFRNFDKIFFLETALPEKTFKFLK